MTVPSGNVDCFAAGTRPTHVDQLRERVGCDGDPGIGRLRDPVQGEVATSRSIVAEVVIGDRIIVRVIDRIDEGRRRNRE